MCFVLSSLYLAAAKAQMQTIIINDFPRSLYKHSFRFLFPFSLVWQHLTTSAVLLCFLIVWPHCRELWFCPVKEELSEGTRKPLWRMARQWETKTDWNLWRDSRNTLTFSLAGRVLTLVLSTFFSSNNRVSLSLSIYLFLKKNRNKKQRFDPEWH